MRKKKTLRYIAILPSIITLMNGFFGFLAMIIICHDPSLRWQPPLLSIKDFSYPAFAAWMIIAGMIADMFDGKIARSTDATSLFGAQLDSLCDAVSFGIAPAMVSYKMLAEEIAELGINAKFIQSLVLFSAIIYAMCALLRLARFNVENDNDTSAHTSFAGLPSPAAAGVIVSLVLFHEGLIPQIAANSRFLGVLAEKWGQITLWSIPIALCIAGLLMVSRIYYPHLANQLRRSKQSFGTMIIAVFVLLFVMWNFRIALLFGFTAYIVYGLVRWLFSTRRRRRNRRFANEDGGAKR